MLVTRFMLNLRSMNTAVATYHYQGSVNENSARQRSEIGFIAATAGQLAAPLDFNTFEEQNDDANGAEHEEERGSVGGVSRSTGEDRV